MTMKNTNDEIAALRVMDFSGRLVVKSGDAAFEARQEVVRKRACAVVDAERVNLGVAIVARKSRRREERDG